MRTPYEANAFLVAIVDLHYHQTFNQSKTSSSEILQFRLVRNSRFELSTPFYAI